MDLSVAVALLGIGFLGFAWVGAMVDLVYWNVVIAGESWR